MEFPDTRGGGVAVFRVDERDKKEEEGGKGRGEVIVFVVVVSSSLLMARSTLLYGTTRLQQKTSRPLCTDYRYREYGVVP